LARQCAELDWKPANTEQFVRFQQLARLVTAAQAAEEGLGRSAEEVQGLHEAADAALAPLAEYQWPIEADVVAANKLCAATLKSEEMGVFAYGTVIGSIPSDRAPQLGGKNLVIFELNGTMETLGLLVKAPLDELTQGSRWLVLGQRIGVPYPISMITDGVERKIEATAVTSTRLISEPK
jgi:hypothetical protein